MKIYPGSVPEFRILLKQDGTEALQVRYVNTPMRYEGAWQDVQVVKEDATNPA